MVGAAISARLAPALFVLYLGSFAPACKASNAKVGPGNADQSQVVAKVGDTVITVGDVDDRINKQSPFVRARYATVEKKKEFVQDMIRFEVMAAEAARRGYDKDPDVVHAMKEQMISKFLERDFESKLKVDGVSEADVEKYYNDHPNEFSKKDEVRVSEILVKDKSKADKVYAEATARPGVAGPDRRAFGDLVSRYSEDEASKERGGDLGFFDKDATTHPKAILDASFQLGEVGDVSAPVQTEGGWAVLMLMQRRPGFSRPLPEVKREIQQRLFGETRTRAMDAFVADLMKNAKVEAHDESMSKILLQIPQAKP